MRNIILIVVLACISLGMGNTEFYSKKQASKALGKALKDKELELVNQVEVVNRDEKSEPIDIYKFRNGSGVEFYAIFTQAPGRNDYFDYVVTVSLDYKVGLVKVLKYRSEYGGEISSRKWLEQFVNYSGGELRYKAEISALSGATISAKSITADVPRVLKILKENCE